MTCYSVQPEYRIFLKGYGFLHFAKNMGKNIGKNMSKSLNRKYSKKLLDHAKQSATGAFKLLQKEFLRNQRTQPVIWLEIELLIKLRASKQSLKNNSETIREKYVLPGLIQKIIDDLS